MPLITYSPSLNQSIAAVNGIDDSTVLMLHADDFIDSSIYNRPITTTVALDSTNVLMGTSSFKFNQDSFLIPNSPDFAFGTGDFTIDFWMRQPASNMEVLCGSRTITSWELGIVNAINAEDLRTYVDTLPEPAAVGTVTISDSNWHHVALVRNGTNITLYVDGQIDISITVASNYNWSNNEFNIGGQAIQSYTGWIDEFRVSKGIARWTAPFVPRTVPYNSVGDGADADNILLLHFDNEYNFNNAPINDANTVLLLEGETYTDSSIANNTFTTSAVIDNVTKYRGTSSLSFNDSTFNLTDQTDFHFGTLNFTIDFWHKQDITTVQYQCGGVLSTDWSIGTFGDDIAAIRQFAIDNPGLIACGNTVINDTNWHHVAIVRSGTRLILFVDGVIDAELALPVNYDWAQDFTIGGRTIPQLTGWVDDFRVSRGVARWTNNFAISSDIRYLDSTVYNHTVNSIGVTHSSYLYGKYVWGITFGNIEGYLSIPASTDFIFSVYDWTIDFWVYFTAVNNTISSLFCTGDNNKGIYFKYTGGASTGQLDLLLGDGTTYTTYTTPYTPSINTWQHIAVTRHSNVYKIFINGNLTNTITTNIRVLEGIYRFIIGGEPSNTLAYRMHGYMDEFRVSKGVVRYDENFIPWSIPYGGFPELPPPSVTFTDLIDVELNTNYTQSSLVSGLVIPTSVSITGTNASYSLDGSNFTTSNSTIQPNGTVWIRVLSSAESLSTSIVTLTIGTTQFNWSVTTKYSTITGNVLLLVNNNPATPAFTDQSIYGASVTVLGSPTTSHPLFTFNSIDYTNPGALKYNNPVYSVGTGEFSFDCWVYRFGNIGTAGLFSLGIIDGVGGIEMMTDANTLSYMVGNNSSSVTIASTPIPLNTWTHIAFVRKNYVCIAYKDGVPLAVVSNASNLTSTAAAIGARYGGGEYQLSGAYLSNVRYMNQAQYGAFTPVSLAPDANATLLLKGSGTAAVTSNINDSSNNSHSITNNNVYSTDAMYFNGVNSYLTIPDSSDWYFTTDVTIEVWIKWSGIFSTGNSLWGQNPGSSSNMRVSIVSATGLLRAYTASDAIYDDSTINLTPNTWVHLAYQKVGTTYILYVNGQVGTTLTNATPLADIADSWYIGGEVGSPIANPFSGAMKEFRISNVARYTAPFTPPATYSNDSNTLLLIHGNLGTSAVIQDEMGHTIIPNGNADITTTTTRFDNVGLYINNNLGGFLVTERLPEYVLGANDFTMEFWINVPSITSNQRLISNIEDTTYSANEWYFAIYVGYFIFESYNLNNQTYVLQSRTDILTNTWYHIAIVKQGNKYGMFVNGVLNSFITSALNLDNNASSVITIGPRKAGSPVFEGYIDEFRLSNGIARYPIVFSVPTTDYA